MRPALSMTLAALICQLLLPATGWSEATENKQYGEVDPDKALLYVIRPKGARGGNSVGQDIFADTSLLMRLRGNAYGFAHLDPGSYTIWGSGCFRQMEFVPGETYYVLCGDLGMATMYEDEGRLQLEEVDYYNPPDPEVEARRAKKEARAETVMLRFQKQWEKQADTLEIEPVQAPDPPSDTAGLMPVPKYSSIELELMENVSSFMSELGESVWFRARQDLRIDGVTWLAAGTPVEGQIIEVHGARSGGRSGGFEIAFSALETPDGVQIPIIGQLIDAGRHKMGKAATAAAVGGLIGSAMVKGKEAFALAGEPWRVWTRHDVWVRPPEPDASSSPEDSLPSPFSVRTRTGLEFNLEKHQEASDITLVVDAEARVSRVELRAIGDWTLPEPVPALHIESGDGSVAATFDGWSLLRHLRPGPDTVPALFSGTLEDGMDFVASGEISWLESSPK